MKISTLGPYALSIGLAAGALSACTLQQAQSSTQYVGSFGLPNAAKPQTATGGALLFGSADWRDGYSVFVWSYPRGKFIMQLSGASGVGMCSDKAGNVWLANNEIHALDMFEHNGYLKTIINDTYGVPWGCSVDPTTGNVAAVHENNGELVVYVNGGGSGTVYSTSLVEGYFCTYDDQGNLFADGLNANKQGQLVELPAGGTTVENISLNQSIEGTGAVQWDGKYLAIQATQGKHYATIDRVQVSGSSGTVVGTTSLTSPRREPAPFAQFWIHGNRISEATGAEGRPIGIWRYPAGGSPVRVIKYAGGLHLTVVKGLAVSI